MNTISERISLIDQAIDSISFIDRIESRLDVRFNKSSSNKFISIIADR